MGRNSMTNGVIRKRAVRADEAVARFRRDPENNRLFLEAETRHDLAARMTEMRRSAGLTQSELARRVGRKQSFVARLEIGAYDRCGLSTLRTFARAMGYDIDPTAMFISCNGHEFSGNSSCSELESPSESNSTIAGPGSRETPPIRATTRRSRRASTAS